MEKLWLKDVTLVAVAGVNVEDALFALKYSYNDIKFGDVKLITPENIEDKDNEMQIVKCQPLNYEQYNHFIVYELWKHIDTDFALIIQDDGFVINPNKWNNEFLKFDYVGALWHYPDNDYSYRDNEGNIMRIGNGGFTLRSKKLLKLATDLGLEWKPYFGFYNEDGFICCHNRHIYQENGCKFAYPSVAKHFSIEVELPETKGIEPFGFHGKNSKYYKQIKNG